MKLLVLDQNGNELKLARVSLIEGGVEIVVGGTHGSTANAAVSREEQVPSVTIDAATATTDTKPAGLFSDDSESDAPGLPSADEGGDTGTVLAASDLPDLDINGRAWDERIDSSNKKKVVATGVWARRRNLDDEFYASVVKSLMGAATEELPSADDDLPSADDDLPNTDDLPSADDDLPGAPDDTPLPENNEIGESDDELKGILGAWG